MPDENGTIEGQRLFLQKLTEELNQKLENEGILTLRMIYDCLGIEIPKVFDYLFNARLDSAGLVYEKQIEQDNFIWDEKNAKYLDED